VVTTPEIAEHLTKQQINTFGGNPVSSATALAVLETIEEEKLMENARVVGDYLVDGLKDLQKSFPSLIGEVRGKGLMLGVEIAAPDKTPLVAETQRIVELSKDDGVIIGKGGLFGNVLRIKPPMNITKENVDSTLKVLRKAMESVAKVAV
jgi:4-aminobutyrate aminotransferase-like enzyme